jgi:hypothetical protein
MGPQPKLIKFLRQGIKDGDFKIMSQDDPPLIQELPRGIPDSIRGIYQIAHTYVIWYLSLTQILDALFEERIKLGEKLISSLPVHRTYLERLALTDHHQVKAQFTLSNDADVLEEPWDPEHRYCMSLAELAQIKNRWTKADGPQYTGGQKST